MKRGISLKTGIICLADFHGANAMGDHIDIWTGGEMLSGEVQYLHRSDDIWFWSTT